MKSADTQLAWRATMIALGCAAIGTHVDNLGTRTVERARKAVTARLRDTIRRIEAALPDLGTHLDRSIVTGNYCRYQPSEPLTWDLRDPPSA